VHSSHFPGLVANRNNRVGNEVMDFTSALPPWPPLPLFNRLQRCKFGGVCSTAAVFLLFSLAFLLPFVDDGFCLLIKLREPVNLAPFHGLVFGNTIHFQVLGICPVFGTMSPPGYHTSTQRNDHQNKDTFSRLS
jgi:hypothetical protein